MFNNRLRSILTALIVLLAVVGAAFFAVDAASATEDETCVPSPGAPAVPGTPEIPAVTEEVFDHWQRYSWTGGPHTPDSAPSFPGPDWQPNVQGDPHGVGVEGAYYRSNGNSGNGDWFYLEAVTTTVVVTPAVPATPGTPEVPPVVCPDTPTDEPTDEPTTPTQEPTPSMPTTEPTTGVETPIVEPTTPATPIEVVEDEEDPVVSVETHSEPTNVVKYFTHESGKVTKVVKDYGSAEDLVEEGL